LCQLSPIGSPGAERQAREACACERDNTRRVRVCVCACVRVCVCVLSAPLMRG
jgi:hypothetical protein